MNHILFLALLALTSVFWALLEIEIEGADGWAKNLPTKQFHSIKLGRKRFLTGYHLYSWLLLATLAHLAFVFTEWTLSKELYLLTFGCGMLGLEDFLWFIFNPAYGIKKYNPRHVTWHVGWTLGVPNIMWAGLATFATLYYLAIITG